eukprot:251064-Chlamydomonas_euryale.AAC.4
MPGASWPFLLSMRATKCGVVGGTRCRRWLTGDTLTTRSVARSVFPSSKPPKCSTAGSTASAPFDPRVEYTPVLVGVAGMRGPWWAADEAVGCGQGFRQPLLIHAVLLWWNHSCCTACGITAGRCKTGMLDVAPARSCRDLTDRHFDGPINNNFLRDAEGRIKPRHTDMRCSTAHHACADSSAEAV